MWQIYHYTPIHIVPKLYWYKDFPRHLQEDKFYACSQKGGKQIVIIIDQSPCYPFLEKILKELFSIQCLYFVLISLGSDLLIFVNINFCQYGMKFINLLILIHQKMSRGIFLDLSKAFDSVWHDGLIYKINYIGNPILFTSVSIGSIIILKTDLILCVPAA